MAQIGWLADVTTISGLDAWDQGNAMHQLKNGEKHPDLSTNRTIVRFRGEIRDFSPNLIRDGSGLLAIAGIFQ